MVCRVCELVNGDTTVKKVCYCNLCQAYICKEHTKDIAARGEAALLEWSGKIGRTVQNFFDKVVAVFSSDTNKDTAIAAPKGRKKKQFPTDEFSENDNG